MLTLYHEGEDKEAYGSNRKVGVNGDDDDLSSMTSNYAYAGSAQFLDQPPTMVSCSLFPTVSSEAGDPPTLVPLSRTLCPP